MYKKINKIIKSITSQIKNEEYKNFLFLEKRWKSKIEKKITRVAKITDYTDKVLTIQTQSPAWKNELNFMRSEIKKNFQQQKLKLKKL